MRPARSTWERCHVWGAAVDTVSQTIKVFAQFDGTTQRVLPGMSGTAKFVNLEK